MSLTVHIYDKRKGLQISSSLDSLESSPRNSVVWIDLLTKDPAALNAVAEKFGLHELTIEDALTEGHAPKIEDFGSYTFMVFRSIKQIQELETHSEESVDLDPEEEEEGITRSVALFLSDDFIITHRMYDIQWMDAALRQVKQIPERTIAGGTYALAHKVIDVLIDRFTRSLSYYEKRIDILEQSAISTPELFEMGDVLELKRELSMLRQIMRDQKVIITRLASERNVIKEERLRRYFRDVDDHALAIIKALDKQIENLVGLRDIYFAMANVRLGDIMRILAVITTIAVPLNLVVGLYGMNFDVIPLLHDPNGFWLVMIVITGVAVSMLYYFKRKRWI